MVKRGWCVTCRTVVEADGWDYIRCSCGDVAVCLRSEIPTVVVKREGCFVPLDEDGEKGGKEEAEKEDKSNEQNDVEIIIDETINRIEKLPQGAQLSPMVHLDYLSLLYILKGIVRLLPRKGKLLGEGEPKS